MEEIWFKNPGVLIQLDKLTKFFPHKDMSKEEKLNAIVRFGLYLSILLYIYNNNYNNLYIIIIVLGITYFIYTNKNLNILGGSQQKEYTYSTVDNPLKNRLVHELSTNKPPAISNECDKKQVSENLNSKLYRSVGDCGDNQHSQRQWFTVPDPTAGDFAKWLYDKPSCKSGDKDTCVENIDNRYNFR
jgi:hypothetical protein